MQPTRLEGEGSEAEELRDRIWTYAQRGVVMIVVFLAGLFVGYQLWGQATQLREQVDDLTERNQSLVKERDTERSKVTLVERDKKELETQIDDLNGKLAAASGKAAGAGAGAAKPDAGGAGAAPPPTGNDSGGGGTQGATVE